MPFPGNSERGIRIERVFVVDHLECARASSAVGRLAAQGLITPRVAGLFAPDEAGRAHSLVEAGGVRGRPVIRF